MLKNIILLGLMCSIVLADLPVHCVKHQVVGEWKLLVGAPQTSKMGPLSCGHSTPDSEQSSYKAGWEGFKESWQVDVNLMDNNKASKKGEETASGQWTMVYDEGFEIVLKNTRYFAFSKYEPNGEQPKSLCDSTLVGWYINHDNGDRGCYHASKAQKLDSTNSLEQVSVVQPEYMNKEQLSRLSLLQISQTPEAISLDQHQVTVDRLNSLKSTWSAKVYDHMVGKSFAEMNKHAGRRKYYQGPRATKTQPSSFLQTSSSTTQTLPSHFDHSEHLQAARAQEQCGSCYAIATMAMLSSRLHMQGERVVLSPQHSLNCNYMNQGCDGGYPYLISRWATEEYLVPETMEPYRARDGDCNQHAADNLPTVYSVGEYGYIGGAYGQNTEESIMKEIYEGGPVVMNFEPNYDFMFYEKGIYNSRGEHSNSPVKQEWEKVDHSVLCYGWGEENGEKYWLLQNSWGPEWGEQGNFRMQRGTDDSAIESMTEYANPIVVNRAQTTTNTSSVKKDTSHEDLETNLSKYKFSIFAQQSLNLRKVQ